MKKHSTALQMFVHTMVMHQEALLVQASTIISQSRYVLFTLQKRISDNTLSSIFAVLILDSGIVYIAWITLGREEPAARQMVFMHQLQRLADEFCVVAMTTNHVVDQPDGSSPCPVQSHKASHIIAHAPTTRSRGKPPLQSLQVTIFTRK
ncbi:hypothetical protein O0I10_003272 [Lichtheimia ornata]|uniref:Rad51-like C-terminal domain-containing protein n=1 Tax=Lichtheimia ornata TaxID=688661 RepID=A0AAD7V8L3_9FUNG|nr:uncharacterized protein O0I10_003272 [Lichtheimia ornata]KAJ8661049.1 hypothetical protein O0I10_003272 [Lichtheimia ornata]